MIMLDNAVQLHDIVAAPAASWWPLAIGWYVVIISGAVLLVTSLFAIRRAYRARHARRLALTQLHQHPPQSLAAVSLLLKQAALAYFPAEHVSSQSQQQWWHFLLQQLSTKQRQRFAALAESVSQASYQPAPQQQPWLSPYTEFADYWLRQALPPSRKNIQALQESTND
ncbi:DUF4381 domain-containing protein [Pseudidiomarina gelatinasegens]|mgnify:CR=1 FL=1|jgi:hypothetical protein|uniref:DUF4381 domain-containing protein n=1 Tax=Pseudidiomarina gelatinasegens TaxID=2487740 RepID=UPI0030ED694B